MELFQDLQHQYMLPVLIFQTILNQIQILHQGIFFVSFDQFVYYQETNGQTGYQDGQDSIVSKTYMNDTVTGNKFDSFLKTSVDLSNGDFFHSFKSQILKEFGTKQIYTFSNITSVEITSMNTTSQDLLSYVPNGIRFQTNIEGITNFPASASGIAIGLTIMTSATSAQVSPFTFTTSEYPQDTTARQTSFWFSDQKLNNNTYFSYRTQSTLSPTGKSPYKADVIINGPFPLTNLESGLPGFRNTTSFYRVWLSIPQTSSQTDMYTFQYSFGINDPLASSSGSFVLSLFFIVILVVLF